MTNYDYLITLPVDKFNSSIIGVVNQFGGNPELLLRFLNAEYVGIKTVRDILNENYSGVKITFRYNNYVYECVSVDDFLKQYGVLSSGILNLSVSNIKTGKNGNKTIFLF